MTYHGKTYAPLPGQETPPSVTAEDFGPEKTYPTGQESPIPGGGRLWDIPEDYMVVFVPQNRNNQSRVNVGGRGGEVERAHGGQQWERRSSGRVR